MKAIDLKNSILQLAIEGKLVPQDPTDEPASVLYEQIQTEKNRLIKEGKIKAPKKNGRINPAEPPFEIPASWIWVKLGEIADFPMGKTPSRNNIEYWGKDYPWVSIADLIDGSEINHTKEMISDKACTEVFKKRISSKGTLLMSFKLTIGKTSILGMDAFHNEAIISVIPYLDTSRIMTNYLFKILSYLTTFTTDAKEAIKGKTLNSTSLYNILIPLPPLSEQNRIVDKIEELEPLVDRYGNVAEELARLISAV